jgi:Family of unknown function (DUF6144)
MCKYPGLTRWKRPSDKRGKEGIMSKTVMGMIEQLGGEVGAATDTNVRARVMAGAETITAKSSGIEAALWAKGAMERLGSLLDEETREQIMERCGANCAQKNSGVLDRAVARRRKFADEEAFIAAEIKKPPAGTQLLREGESLVQVYTPQAYRYPMRCYCALVKDLPEGEVMSRTYCNCSKAFVQTVWEAALGRPVRVELIESAVTGSSECRFRITPVPRRE